MLALAALPVQTWTTQLAAARVNEVAQVEALAVAIVLDASLSNRGKDPMWGVHERVELTLVF